MIQILNGSSPWGAIQTDKRYVRDGRIIAIAVTTASHGGIWVAPEFREHIPEHLRETAYSKGGWFEEDCDWCIPYLYLDLGPLEDEPRQDSTIQAIDTIGFCHKVDGRAVVRLVRGLVACTEAA